jgi:hypothetical protein
MRTRTMMQRRSLLIVHSIEILEDRMPLDFEGERLERSVGVGARALGERANDRLDAPGTGAEPFEGMGWTLSGMEPV